jgi:hypothetical protein
VAKTPILPRVSGCFKDSENIPDYLGSKKVRKSGNAKLFYSESGTKNVIPYFGAHSKTML